MPSLGRGPADKKTHDGIIHVCSEKGKWSTFTIRLPASSKPVLKDTLQRERLTRGTESVLLVDDEEMIIDMGKRMIESLGYQVMTAHNGMKELSEKLRNVLDDTAPA